ncbi:MAG: hypothetical protein HKN91_08905 [Acidimicrobiia bacterium]|nr:hypothetical protein [Acidimicrobiia bacterium]
MRFRWLIVAAVFALVATACSSGPSSDGLRPPTTTTTTEPPPEGVIVVIINNGAFRPSNLDVDLDETPIVRWLHDDTADREYVVEARNGEFMSPPLNNGDSFEFDFSTLEPGIYRYFSFLGLTRVPGTVDTRPEQ